MIEHLSLEPIQNHPRWGVPLYKEEQRQLLLKKRQTLDSRRNIHPVRLDLLSGEILDALELEQYSRILEEGEVTFYQLRPHPLGPLALDDSVEEAREADRVYILHRVAVPAHAVAQGAFPVWI